MKRILLLLSLVLISGCKTILVLGFHKDMAIETLHNPWTPDAGANAEFRVEKDWN